MVGIPCSSTNQHAVQLVILSESAKEKKKVSDGVTGCEVFLLLQRPFGQFLNHWDCLSGDGTPKSCKGNSIDETRGFIALVICNKTRSFHRNTWLLPSTSLRER